jgi:hypothetical protein
MVYTNPIMTTHLHITIDPPPMNSIAIGRYKNINVEKSKRRVLRTICHTSRNP